MLDISLNHSQTQWDDYVFKKPAAQYSHLFDWAERLSSTYSLPLFRLSVVNTENQRIIGILAVMLFSPPGKEVRLISLPYTDSAGMLADDRQCAHRLLSAALELADRVGASHLELRQDKATQSFFRQYQVNESWKHASHNFKTSLIRPLPSSSDTLWSLLSAKVRNQVRKARRCGCIAKTGGIELLPDFYEVFSVNMRDLGSPVHTRDLFHNIMESEALRTAIIVIYMEGVPAAAAFVLRNNHTLCNPWASSLRRYRPACPNMLLYWSMLEYALEHRCRWFDFGRSTPNAPTCRFKIQWDAEMEPLSWHVFSRKPHDWHPGNESLEIAEWKDLDLERSRREGPTIRRWISL